MAKEIADALVALLRHPPGSISDLVAAISPGIYLNLKSAIELGKWEDGRRLEREQLEQCIQLLILYEAQSLPETERTGADLKKDCKSASMPAKGSVEEAGIIKIQGND